MKQLSIVIVSYNNLQVLKNCLNSIEEYNDIGENLECIVVEQSPSNEIYETIQREYKWISVVRAKNRGFGAGNNIGAKIARSPYLLFLNPDTILVESIAKHAIEKFETDKQLGLFGYSLLGANGEKLPGFYSINSYGIVNKIVNKCYLKLNRFVPKRMYIQGADMFVRAKAFNDVGGFDEEIFMYCEEPDLCRRIIDKGYAIRYFPEKRIVHLQGMCTEEHLAHTIDMQLDSFEYLCKKNNWDYKRIMKQELTAQKIKTIFAIITFSQKDISSSRITCDIIRAKIK